MSPADSTKKDPVAMANLEMNADSTIQNYVEITYNMDLVSHEVAEGRNNSQNGHQDEEHPSTQLPPTSTNSVPHSARDPENLTSSQLEPDPSSTTNPADLHSSEANSIPTSPDNSHNASTTTTAN